MSPAEELTIKTTDALSVDLVSGHIAIVLVACSETVIGLLLIAGRCLRLAIYLLAGQLIGILAPLVLFTGRRRRLDAAGARAGDRPRRIGDAAQGSPGRSPVRGARTDRTDRSAVRS